MAPPILFMKCVSCGKRLVCVSSCADLSPSWIFSTISGNHSNVFFSPDAPTQPAIPACPSILPVSIMLSSIRFCISDFIFSLVSSVSAIIPSISAATFSCSFFIFSFCSLTCSFLSSAPSLLWV